MDAAILNRGFKKWKDSTTNARIDTRATLCARKSLSLCTWEYQKQRYR